MEDLMAEIAQAVACHDFEKYKDKIHTLKGNVGSISASRLYYAAYYIQRAHHDQDHKEMLLLYPLLVETCIDFQRFSIKLQQQLGGQASETKSTTTTPIADPYLLAYSSTDDYFYCLNASQTSK